MWNDGLEGTHLEIAKSDRSRISVLAGPGTGKTTYAMLRHVQRTLENGTAPERILVISFTRTAAKDLKSKLEVNDTPGANGVRATTLHSFALDILQEEAVIPGLDRTRRILLDHECDTMLHDLPSNFGDVRERRAKLNELLSGWDDGGNIHPGTTDVPEERAFERVVLSWLREHRAMLVGEVVSLAYSHLVDSPQSEVFERFDHIYVDEYQDLNGVEQELIGLLADRSGATLMIVGDDDQSIYGFRNANPEGIRSFHQESDVQSFELSICGRCPVNFVEAANMLISSAPDRNKTPLTARENIPGQFFRYQWPSLKQEVTGLAQEIRTDIQSGEVEPGKILVLSNRRFVGKWLRDELVKLGISAESYYGQEPLERRKAQERFSWLQIMAYPTDATAKRVAIAGTQSDRRQGMYRTLREISRRQRSGIVATLNRLTNGEIPVDRSTRTIADVNRLVLDRIETLSKLSLPELVEEVFPEGEDQLAEIREHALDCLESAGNVKDLVDSMIQSMVQRDVPDEPTFVRVMSLHKSKGLTADDVYITTAVEQVIPFYKSAYSEEEVEFAQDEGRRLLYVALTRAQRKLVISYPRTVPVKLGNGWGISQKIPRSNGQILLPPSSYLREMRGTLPEAVGRSTK